ncbi:MAG TPA: prepilin-type N-terminal cleavage/methylation domain-containing protein [Bradyrhizobium sp.]|uniref:PulJ/GspJ family protein n=1 Tax=Bradyrhizobium sp. TaxID=376 RepID=UPI002D7E9A0A|nr:prepilin-type N-terminal cleavage/methylation domain-containing protein [Bradyrhizobium sp.]HET7886505.1 prepilin-type N-terminal cleavage/methylation domain-containing protein [Bradyrhizobium sp.]
MTKLAARQDGEDGFTLIETLVALALTGLVLSALANITAQWLPNWNRGLDRIQRSEMISITLQRMADDLAAAQYVSVGGEEKKPLFSGSERSVIFVRTALGPNAGPALDVVRLSETSDQGGLATVRSRTAFRPMPPESASDRLPFGEPVLLLRAPYQLLLAYAGDDQTWHDAWRDAERLPAKVRLTVRDSSNGSAISTVATVHVQSSAQGDCKPADGACNSGGPAAQAGQQAGAPQAGGAAQGGMR